MLLDMEADKLYREGKADGGMLTDDREQYKLGKLVSKVMGKSKKDMSLGEKIKLTEDMYKDSIQNVQKIQNEMGSLQNEGKDIPMYLYESLQAEQNLVVDLERSLEKMGVTPSTKNFNQQAKNPKGESSSDDFMRLRTDLAEGGKPDYIDIDGDGNKTEPMKTAAKQRDDMAQGGMLEQSEPMESDEVMEDNYLEFVLDEALTPEEQSFLTQELEQNMQLAMIFDKVVDVAQEFAGSGPVEGPGSGVSDSIPARLSDGEFVFTAKAVEEIGADNLMAMMKDAEMKADGRQDLAEGGQPEEDTVEMPVDKPASKQDIRVVKTTVDNGGKGLLDEDEIAKSIKSKMMLDNRTGRHVQS
jgi:hypothetical protein